MSRFLKQTITVLFISLSFLSCTKNSTKPHFEQPPISQFGPRGLVEKNISLKFKFDKSAVSKLQAVISLPFDYNETITYEWKLGQNVKLVSGALKGEINGLKKNQSQTLTLELEGLNTDESRYVRFEAFGSNPKHRLYTGGVFNSNLDSSFEKLVKEIEENK